MTARAVEEGILSFVHHTHAAVTHLFNDAVVGNRLADHEAIASQQDAGELRNEASIRSVYR